MRIKAYLTLMRASIIEFLQFRMSAFVMFLGNVIYLIVIYNLWRAIYASVDGAVINGMSFNDTMIYLVLASAQFTFMEAYLVWDMGRSIQSGKIVMDLLKPVPYDRYLLFSINGGNVSAFFVTFIPTFVIVQIITHGAISMGVNILYYVIAAIIGSLINFVIDFFVGTICLYTQSIWGINIMKQVVVLFFSGATVPLSFFPDGLYKVAKFLPFHAIYDTPLQFLTNNSLTAADSWWMIGQQVLWLVAMYIVARLFWKVSERVITVNGG